MPSRFLGIQESDVVFSAAKLFFADSLGNGLTFPLSVGATAILLGERPTPAAVFALWRTADDLLRRTDPYGGMLASPELPSRWA